MRVAALYDIHGNLPALEAAAGFTRDYLYLEPKLDDPGTPAT